MAMGFLLKKWRLFSELKNSHPSFFPYPAKEFGLDIKNIGIIPILIVYDDVEL